MSALKKISNPSGEPEVIDAGDVDEFGEKRPVFKTRPFAEIRANWFHKITHFLAVAIIVVFLFSFGICMIYQKTDLMPNYFIAIVSTVVGFYFGGYLKDRRT